MPGDTKTSAKEKAKLFFAYFLSGLGGLGIALQNYMAVSQLINGLTSGVLAATAAGQAALHSLGIVLGGLCSGFMNLLFNIPLLKGFIARVSELRFGSRLKGWDKLTTGQKFIYWAGIGIFITSGVMLGLTAFAFGPIGVIAALGIAAGILVALISTVQELETWLERYDEKKKKAAKKASDEIEVANQLENLLLDENEKTTLFANNEAVKLSLWQRLVNWKNSLTKAKVLAGVITIGNVIALSLLMAMGVASFLTGVGVAALPALLVGLGIAFTAGAFTEYYFYSKFINNFCEKFDKTWNKFKTQSKWPVFGFIATSMNALTVGVLTYVGITLIVGLVVAAGVAVPPFGVIVAIAALAALFAATASFMLGIKFWTKNMPKEPKAVTVDGEEENNDHTLSTDASVTVALQNNGEQPTPSTSDDELDDGLGALMTSTDTAITINGDNLKKVFEEGSAAPIHVEPILQPKELSLAGFSLLAATKGVVAPPPMEFTTAHSFD